MSKSSITPYAGVATGGALATLLTGGGSVGLAGAAGAFGLPFLAVLAPLALAGWTAGKILDAVVDKPAPRMVIDVTPVTIQVKEVRIPWEYSEVMGTFAHLY